MNRNDKFRKNAEEAQKQADLSTSELDRAAWLRLAQDWLDLIRNGPRSNDEDAD